MASVRNGYRERLVLAVDVGSTVLRCHVYNQACDVIGRIQVLNNHHGCAELDPETLWQQFVGVVEGAVRDAGIQLTQVASLGISTQRATFINWNNISKDHFHSFLKPD
uniref:Carbohydrate kinase FGGY N-terminal domain-containing protein n=1 Tax=Leptobrachium leishanense TaxID=445787 RepID=A0A8C5WHK9_9ANUR